MLARFRKSAWHLAGIALGLCAVALASAAPLCTNRPRYGWVSVEEVEARLRDAGFRLLRLRVTNEACYSALVINSEGEKLEMRLHPASSDILDIGPVLSRGTPKS
jgi:hypothetical protein